jgi:predicted porin
MQRIHLNRLAVATALLGAAAAAPAFAQSSVTVWGRLNTSVENQKFGNADAKWIEQNNSSRLGFRGTEDIGGGLKAGFAIEHGFHSDDGTANSATAFWNRRSEVNLTLSSLGTVRLGKFFSEAYFATADYVSMHNHDTGTSSDALYAYVANDNNKVAYHSPTFSGATVDLARSFGEGVTNATYDAAVNWDGGPLHLGGGYSKNDADHQFAVRGLYEMGQFTFGGYVQRDKNAAGNRTNIRLSGMYTLDATEFHLNFGKAGDRGNIANSDAKQFTAAVNYNLSKRTKVYAFYTKVDDNTAGLYGGDFRSVAFGVRHNF